MDYKVADSLRKALLEAVPQPSNPINKYATGNLKSSIQDALPNGTNSWIITIGNSSVTGMGRRVDGMMIVNNTPSNVYAAAVNNNKTIRVFEHRSTADKVLRFWDKSSVKMTTHKNHNYHWANNAIQDWITANGYSLATSIEEDNEDEQI